MVPELSSLFHDCFLPSDPGRELTSQSPLVRRRLGTRSSPVPSPGYTASDHQGDRDQLCRRGGNNRRTPAFACCVSPLAFHPQRQLGFLPSPRGTVPFPSPRQHGGEGAQPRKSPAKLPGSFGMGGRYKEEAPTPSVQGTSRQVGAQPSWCPTCPQNAFSRRQVSGRKVPQAEPTAAHAVGSVSGDPLGLGDGGCEEALASLSQPGPASLDLREQQPAGDSGLPTKHLLCANTLLGPEDANGDKSTGSCLRSAASLLELSTSQAPSCLCTSQKFTKHLLCARHCQAKLGRQLNLKKCEHM